MWNRKEIKQKGRASIRVNYWKTFFSSLIMIVFAGGTTLSLTTNSADNLPEMLSNIYENEIAGPGPYNAKILGIIVVLVCSLLLLTTVIEVLFAIFIKNPVGVGFSKFLYKTILAEDENDISKGQIADNLWAFDHHYMNVVKVMFVRGLFTTIGYLLLVIPGFYKSYQYRLVPYILSENSELSVKEALETSKKMMDGHKKDAFILDLSFIPWHVLGIITLGILEIFFVYPYINLTNAEIYHTLSKQYYGEE